MTDYEIVIDTIQGYDIEVAEAGQKENPVIVFAHGLGGNLGQWENQIHYFSRDYRVISFSLQGHGNSSKVNNPDAYTIEKYGEIAFSILDKRGISSCIWVGNSMGGVIGYELMKRHPSLIKHMISNGTVPKLIFKKALLKLIGILDKFLIKTLGYERYINIAVKASLKDETKQIILKKLFMSALPLAIITSHQLLGNYDYLDIIQNRQKPVTFILTPNDKDINKELSKHRSKLEGMPHVQIVENDSGGHVFNIELPDHYNHLLDRIIKEKI